MLYSKNTINNQKIEFVSNQDINQDIFYILKDQYKSNAIKVFKILKNHNMNIEIVKEGFLAKEKNLEKLKNYSHNILINFVVCMFAVLPLDIVLLCNCPQLRKFPGIIIPALIFLLPIVAIIYNEIQKWWTKKLFNKKTKQLNLENTTEEGIKEKIDFLNVIECLQNNEDNKAKEGISKYFEIDNNDTFVDQTSNIKYKLKLFMQQDNTPSSSMLIDY